MSMRKKYFLTNFIPVIACLSASLPLVSCFQSPKRLPTYEGEDGFNEFISKTKIVSKQDSLTHNQLLNLLSPLLWDDFDYMGKYSANWLKDTFGLEEVYFPEINDSNNIRISLKCEWGSFSEGEKTNIRQTITIFDCVLNISKVYEFESKTIDKYEGNVKYNAVYKLIRMSEPNKWRIQSKINDNNEIEIYHYLNNKDTMQAHSLLNISKVYYDFNNLDDFVKIKDEINVFLSWFQECLVINEIPVNFKLIDAENIETMKIAFCIPEALLMSNLDVSMSDVEIVDFINSERFNWSYEALSNDEYAINSSVYKIIHSISSVYWKISEYVTND